MGKVGIQKRTLLIVGCGDIALRAAPLLRAHYRVMGLCLKPESRTNLRLRGITPVYGDLDVPDSLGEFPAWLIPCCISHRRPITGKLIPALPIFWLPWRSGRK